MDRIQALTEKHKAFLEERLAQAGSGQIIQSRSIGTVLAFELNSAQHDYTSSAGVLIRDKALEQGIYLRPAIAKWQRQWPQSFRFIEALSGEQREGAFHGRTDAALRAHCPDLSAHALYCCGSPAMVQAVRDAAHASGLAPSRFHADVFVNGPADAHAP